MTSIQAVVIGASAGGVQALLEILPALPFNFPVPVMAVVHIPADRTNVLAPLFATKCQLPVKEAEDKEPPQNGFVYFAPSDYHLLVETSGDLALSSDEPVNYSRPSIDILFESAADYYGDSLLGILLTGANEDGSRGLAAIAKAGGQVIVEDPASAYSRAMPEAGLKSCPSARVETLAGIVDTLRTMVPS